MTQSHRTSPSPLTTSARSAHRRSRRLRVLWTMSILATGTLVSASTLFSGTAHAQWCCGSKPPAPYPVGAPYAINNGANPYTAARPMIPVTPITPSNGTMSSYYGNYGMMPPNTGTGLPNGIPQTVVSAMPTASYDTQWQRTPVTYYRPVTQYDPNYGTTVTSLQPCTSYQYQAARVPMIAPTPVGGAYAQASNQWPAINQPGYYPTGVASSNTMLPTLAPAAASTVIAPPAIPNYPAVQSLPNSGIQVPAVQPGTSITSGMPFYSAAPNTAITNPTTSYSTQATFTPFTVPQTSATAPTTISASANGTVPSQTPLSNGVYYGGAQPTANCPNGLCPTTGNLTPPVVPGASSVVPYGPVTYLPAKPATDASQPVLPPSGLAPTTTPTQPPVTSGATLDPEAARAPSLPLNNSPAPSSQSAPIGAGAIGSGSAGSTSVGSNSGVPNSGSAKLWSDSDPRVANMVPMNRLPVVPIDSATSSPAKDSFAQGTLPKYPTPQLQNPQYPTSRSIPANPFPGAKSNYGPTPTPVEPPPMNFLPLKAPVGLDAKPNWNPKLLEPTAPSSSSSNNPAPSTPSVNPQGIDAEKVARRQNIQSVNHPDHF